MVNPWPGPRKSPQVCIWLLHLPRGLEKKTKTISSGCKKGAPALRCLEGMRHTADRPWRVYKGYVITTVERTQVFLCTGPVTMSSGTWVIFVLTPVSTEVRQREKWPPEGRSLTLLSVRRGGKASTLLPSPCSREMLTGTRLLRPKASQWTSPKGQTNSVALLRLKAWRQCCFSSFLSSWNMVQKLDLLFALSGCRKLTSV